MSTADLDISLVGGPRGFTPMDTVEASALWALSTPPKSLEARLIWFTRGKGTEDVQQVAVESLASPGLAGEHRFTFRLPSSPYSFSGKLVSLIWAIELVALPDGKSARCEFVVSPTGHEILLHPSGNLGS